MSNRISPWIGLCLGGIALAGIAAAQGGDARPHHRASAPRIARMRADLERSRLVRRAFAPKLEDLSLTDDQRVAALDAARAVEDLVREARRRAARTIVDARAVRTGDRDVTRRDLGDRLRENRRRTLEEIRPYAERVLASLTPEQRGALEARVARRGRSAGPEVLVRFVSRILARPMTVPLLEAGLVR